MAGKNSGTETKKRNLWMLENVDEATKTIIKLRAVKHDIHIAVALKQLVKAGRSALAKQKK